MGTGVALAIGSMVVSAATTFASMKHADSQADAQRKAAQRKVAAVSAEKTRQQVEVNRVSQEKKSDVIKKAESELGALRVAAGETGASAGSMARMVAELGAVEGTDIGRIENNRKSDIAKLDADKKAARIGYTNTVTQAFNQRDAATTNAALGFVGSGLQIASGEFARQEQLDATRNRTN